MGNEKKLQEAYIDKIYESLKKEILEVDGVVEFTSGGFQNIVQGISKVLGRKMHKGMLIHDKKDMIEINVSISVKYGVKIHEVACEVQKKIKNILLRQDINKIESINVTVTELVK